jgi:sugar lactone lactonase YvrE
MNKHLLLLFALHLFFSCTHKVEDSTVITAPQDSTLSVNVNLLADLPDSLQPETIFLKNAPAPKSIPIPDKPVSFTYNLESGPRTLNLTPTQKTKVSFSPTLKNYTTDQGLALDLTTCGYTDRKGNLWFGTTVNGVSKYDGHSFTNYNTTQGLIDNRINSIIEDSAGNIWFATKSGVSKFDGTTFSTIGNFQEVLSIFEDTSGNIWLGAYDGLYKYAGDSMLKYHEPDGLTSNKDYILEEDPKGVLYVCTNDDLFRYDGTRFTNMAVSMEVVDSIYRSKSRNAWDRIPTAYKLTKFPDLVSAESVTEDKSGNIWVCTVASGVVKYSGQAFLQLTSKSIRSVFEDQSGNIWLSGADKCITRFDGE